MVESCDLFFRREPSRIKTNIVVEYRGEDLALLGKLSNFGKE